MTQDPGPALTELARACGVATTHTDWRGREVAVPAATIRRVLAAMDFEVDDDASAAAALEQVRERPWRRVLPPSVVARPGEQTRVEVCVPSGARVSASCALEAGGVRELLVGDEALETRTVEGRSRERRLLSLPADLPAGYHRVAVSTEQPGDGGDHPEEALLVVAPPHCPLPERRMWGWMVQLYAVRSSRSWGIGDFADLGHLGAWSGAEQGAGLLLCNPLHAATPVVPQVDSPYFPSSRRFANPIYLRVDDVPEIADLDAETRTWLARIANEARTLNDVDRIDRDAVFRAKRSALETLHRAPRRPGREAAYQAYRRREGADLDDFATFCALAEQHGVPFGTWPHRLRHPASAGVDEARHRLRDRIDFHTWLQWLCDEQLVAAQEAALGAGMPLGVVHDLAVGVDPGGADAWALQDELAPAVTVGAPPDAFNQLGQDWQLPPLRPDRLPATGFAPLRAMLRSVLRHGGGLRIDHVMGLFRLYWIPEGLEPSEGAYVRYPADALLGVLSLEAERAGAVVVGEDLGTVEPGVREELASRRVLGSRLVYFERTPDGEPLPPGGYPELALSSVNTHDLPTAAGWWDDGGVGVKAELGLLDEDTPADEERGRIRAEQRALADMLRREGLLGQDPGREDLVLAMHALLARTPSLLVAASLGDAVGDVRQPNLPGTVDEYPNWRLPIATTTPDGSRPVLLDELVTDPAVARHAAAIAEGRSGPGG